MAVSAIPKGFHAVTPYLIIEGASKAIEFYKEAFAAELVMQMPMPDGGVAHAEIIIGDSYIMLSDAYPEMEYKSPQQLGGTPVNMMLYVEDVDAVFAKALSLGAKELRPVHDQFYGDRLGTLADPFGHIWNIATHKEDLTEQELIERMGELMSKEQDA
ncbi:VOC family protein [Pseudoalteromonas shioyasakiensis]|uniref:VOC family protein n=1 Tax=Pseudoalteromonas TaxID=53246 RepID=UPI000C93BA14|nr:MULTISPECIES: VOC family protein [Pseudoalteromonas]MAD05080.1 glyoxalase [Pseudoalteromonas sp.]MCG9708847.1 VOC family protein [Pseudoalteromonas sp. Isolate3]MCP4588565.1 VOC family protein [Pseudoalteromonas sp.]MCQ8882084.1 VOC family protein [Pseudoalteromonas shioyasakiensis]NIZ05378.1 VOC family protein [Pseudoalteromonas sp. HF66]|tara:strand:+ start:22089 stop:22562 length:474 start_codon:yes stop_codon:yes gene_type:complete